MGTFQPFLDAVHFELRFERGYTYLDRCGQTLLDIEDKCDGWVAGEVSPSGGKVANAAQEQTAYFDTFRFSFSAQKPKSVDSAAESGTALWTQIRRNLGLQVVVRLGCRMQYLLPVKSPEEAEQKVAKSPFNIVLGDSLDSDGYRAKVRQPIAVLERGGAEFRVALQGVTHSEGEGDIRDLMRLDIRSLPSGQRQARLDRETKMAKYAKKPRFAVLLDVDGARFDIADSKPAAIREAVTELTSAIKSDFFPLLQKL